MCRINGSWDDAMMSKCIILNTVVPHKTNALQNKKLTRQMVLATRLMTRKTNVPMAMLRKMNVFCFLFLPHVY